MGMLKFYCNMAHQNKIKTADHARDKYFQCVYIVQDHLNGFIQQVHL